MAQWDVRERGFVGTMEMRCLRSSSSSSATKGVQSFKIGNNQSPEKKKRGLASVAYL